MKRAARCRFCADQIVQPPTGRPRLFCSTACRQAAAYHRTRARARQTRTDDWPTPQALFDRLHDEWGFGLDAAARAENAKCTNWLGPDHPDPQRRDGLLCDWAELASARPVWLNPPYRQPALRDWLNKAATTAAQGTTVVALLPASVGARWWTELVVPFAQIEVISGRLAFGDGRGVAPFWSALAVYARS